MAGGGGAWKVAYADFVTAMMAFFMVMWLTAQSPQTKQAIAGYFQDPWGTSSENSAPASLLAQRDARRRAEPGHAAEARAGQEAGCGRLRRQGQRSAQAKSRWAQKRKVHFLQDSDRTTPAMVVPFDEASVEISDAGKSQLDRLIPNLVGKLNKIEIRGHTTRRPLPTDSPYHDLWQLAYARCQAVMTVLRGSWHRAGPVAAEPVGGVRAAHQADRDGAAERKRPRRGVLARRNGGRTSGHSGCGRRRRAARGAVERVVGLLSRQLSAVSRQYLGLFDRLVLIWPDHTPLVLGDSCILFLPPGRAKS